MDKEEKRLYIQKQIAFEEKAHRYVEQLVLSASVSKEVLQDVINQIMPGHYADITEERSIAKLCGYPLCANELVKVSQQKFHISLKQKKIYNITERKLFCSNFCYKASKYLGSQIPSSPLWLRNDNFDKVDFLEKVTNECPPVNPGEETIKLPESLSLNPADQIPDEESNSLPNDLVHNDTPLPDTEYRSTIEAKLPNTSLRSTCLIEAPAQKNTKHVNVDIEKLSSCLEEWCTVDTPLPDTEYRSTIEAKLPNASLRSTCLIEAQNMTQKNTKPVNVDIEKLCSYLEEWCTVDTFKFLYAFNKNKNICSTQDKNTEKVARLESQELNADRKSYFAQRFIQEKVEWQSEVGSTNAPKDIQMPSRAFVAPPIDSKAQDVIRHRIVFQKLKHGLSGVLIDFNLSSADFSVDLGSLIKSFKFTNQNMSLKYKEWKLMATALLHGFAFQDENTALLLRTKEDKIDELLKESDISKAQFDKVLEFLKTNIDKQEISASHSPTGEIDDYNNDDLD